MSFFQTDKSQEALKENSFEYIKTSGIYDVTIDAVSVVTNEHNARSLNFNIDYKGSKTTIYGLRLDNNNGEPNFGAAIFNRLCVILDIDEVQDPEPQTLLIGKDKKPTNLLVLDQFSGLQVKMRILYTYDKYNDKIVERRDISNFYRIEDGATALEITNGSEVGVQLAKDMKYADNIKYTDKVTPEEVEAWKAAKKGNAPKAATPSPATNPNPF